MSDPIVTDIERIDAPYSCCVSGFAKGPVSLSSTLTRPLPARGENEWRNGRMPIGQAWRKMR